MLAPPGLGQLALDLAAGVPRGDLAAAVVELLALPEAELQLRLAALRDVELQRDERQALRLRAAQELVDLVAMEQELPIPLRLVVRAVAALPGRDVRPDEPRLALVDARNVLNTRSRADLLAWLATPKPRRPEAIGAGVPSRP